MSQCAAAIDILLHNTAADVHCHITLDDTILTTAEGAFPDGTATDIQRGATYSCLIRIGLITAGCSIDITATAVFSTDDGIAGDSDIGGACHSTHRAGTIDIANHMTAIDEYRGVSANNTGVDVKEGTIA